MKPSRIGGCSIGAQSVKNGGVYEKIDEVKTIELASFQAINVINEDVKSKQLGELRWSCLSLDVVPFVPLYSFRSWTEIAKPYRTIRNLTESRSKLNGIL